jgi:acetyl esterase/lipase
MAKHCATYVNGIRIHGRHAIEAHQSTRPAVAGVRVHRSAGGQEFIERYRAAGGSVELHLFEGMSEALITSDPAAPQSIAAVAKIVEFVHRELGSS